MVPNGAAPAISVPHRSQSIRMVGSALLAGPMSKLSTIGWCAMLAGIALWTFGYFVAGHPALINWHAYAPWWIADFLPNIESEIGMVLAYGSMVLIYWPTKKD